MKLDAVPGGKLLYTGKVVDVKREVKGGWTIGTATLEPFDQDEGEESSSKSEIRQLILSYQVRTYPWIEMINSDLTWNQNEFFSAELQDPAGKLPSEMLCITPDLITLIDSHTGTALATHELRYGLSVAAIGMPAPPLWLTEAGLKAGGPQAFG